MNNNKYNTQKKLKNLKKEIAETSAINVGYHYSIMQNLPNYAIVEAVKEIAVSGLINSETSEADAQNIIVTEAVKKLNFHDFKEVSNFFF